jgi:hypothetical protein
MAFKRSNLIKLGVEQEELELEDLSIDQRLTPLLISESVWEWTVCQNRLP